MKHLLLTILLTTLLTSCSSVTASNQGIIFNTTDKVNVVNKTISYEFNDTNDFFVVTASYDEALLERFIKKVATFKKKTMYIYYDSPGGSVISLNRMLGIMENSDIKFICMARFAASAAFTMFEMCDERYLLADGILMSHDASIGLQGNIHTIKGMLDMYILMLETIERKIAKRMKLSFEEYDYLKSRELWMNIDLARKYNAIDGEVKKLSCSEKLIKQTVAKDVSVMTILGPMTVTETFSACPLLTAPIKNDK